MRYPLVGTFAFALTYTVALWLGRLTLSPGTQIAMIWPAAGIALLWVLSYWRGTQSRTGPAIWGGLVLLTGLTIAVNYLSGAPALLALTYGLANLIQAIVAALIFVREPGMESLRLDSRQHVVQLLVSLFCGSIVSIPFGPMVAVALGYAGPNSMWQWVLRNTASAFIVGALGLAALHDNRTHERSRRMWVNRLLLVLTTVLVLWLVFFAQPDASLLFLILPVSIWAATTLSVTATALHTLAISTATITLTLLGIGPFHATEIGARAALSQAFVLVVAVLAVSLVIDRSERSRLMDEVEASKVATEFQVKLLDTIVDTMSEGVVVCQEDGSVVWTNAAAHRLLHDAREDADPDKAYSADFDPLFLSSAEGEALITRALRGEGVPPVDITIAGAGDQERTLSVQAHPLSYEGSLALAILRDVTESSRRTAELTNFAGVVAHDLLNPIGSIRGWVEVLGEEIDEKSPGLGAEPLRHLGLAADRMRTLVTDLLNYSVTREGRLSPEHIRLGALASEVGEARAETARLRGNHPRLSVDADVDVFGDRVLVRQLLDNLVSNAVKYTAPGGEADIQITARAGNDGWVRVRVDDRGVGLPAGQEELVFQEFHRVAEHKKAYQGTGLGLSICRRIVERHGGHIRAMARSGGGTRFEFTLPADPATMLASLSPDQQDQHPVGAVGSPPTGTEEGSSAKPDRGHPQWVA